MFAFAICSESRKRLVLGRDRLGIKPLYFAHRGGDIFFGSELKAIFVHPEIPPPLRQGGLNCFPLFKFVPLPRSPVDGHQKPASWPPSVCAHRPSTLALA